ncbi:hypothetical protein [Streptomyces sp. NPDC018031]|uniref:hypothetical protein n=1 Tax=Streptomyces sp. NPDC018031 TaxID=3365033 RepID=UPI0037A153DE
MPIPTGDPLGSAGYEVRTVAARQVRRTDLLKWRGRFRELRNMFTTNGGKHFVFADGTSCTIGDYVGVDVKRQAPVPRR